MAGHENGLEKINIINLENLRYLCIPLKCPLKYFVETRTDSRRPVNPAAFKSTQSKLSQHFANN